MENINPSQELEDDRETDLAWDEFAKLVAARRKKDQQAYYPSVYQPVQDEDILDNFMYGQYSRQLGDFAKLEGLKQAEKRRIKEEKARKKELQGYQGKLAKTAGYIWRHSFAKLGEDWVFLALLGIIMAILSFLMDKGIMMCNKARIWLYSDITVHPLAQYAAWVTLPVCLILFSAGFAHLVAPQSIGSGIPEMKTILRGVALKEYLTFKTILAKVIGLTATLGSGMPLGKEGPFVHIASIAATLLSKLVTGFQGIYENESRTTEMLAAAAAVGVGSCFAAPVGGVLFSIEVTTVYFAVRNYWRGFFAAVCGAAIFRLLSVWFEGADTVTALFKTNFTMDFPFDPQELFVFAIIGVISGFGGALYVWMHRQYVKFMRKSKTLNNFLQKNRFLYPGIVAWIVASISFPLGTGQFIAGDLTTHQQVVSLFSNFTWTKDNLTVEEQDLVNHWITPYSGVWVSLTGFVLFTFFFSIICSTIPVPSGIFIPVFKIGAGLGRIVGELMHTIFPLGMRYGGKVAQIIPGGYATAGAAAFSGSVTHTISVSVIVFEMTGQITHIIPIMIAVLTSNAIAALLQPSIYDSIILIKKLPYLPDLLPSSSGMYTVYVEDFMVRGVKYIFRTMSYEQLYTVLKDNKNLHSFPIVDNPDSMVLLGSIQRMHLIQLIDKQIGKETRLQVVAERRREAQKQREEEEKRQAEERQRRPSRFQVVPVSSENQLNVERASYTPGTTSQPKKSILKKTNSFTFKNFAPFSSTSPSATPYTTVTGAESKMRQAFEAIFRKSYQLQDVNNEGDTILDIDGKPQIVPSSPTGKKVQLPKERICDMSPEDQKIWESEQLQAPVDFSKCHIDPAPFQLVERTSLLKVHSIFSMVGVNHAYVTAIGRLVGVVGLKELRKAIEDVNSGNIPPHVDLHTNGLSVNEIKDPETEVDANTALVSKV
ncbi:chloride channel protein 2 [Holotrichia oblita]|uniref:Chloride channel protein 2 n=1 Tax=Holotrichia oblita TaxID=644536 RepID=A0ACB9SGW0_HOLOL|nr:chloride channel protein 2 [Holotrichia oblita]